MTVQKLFEAEKIDRDFIGENFDGDYWENCERFLREHWNCPVEKFTPRQYRWLTKILEDCVEKRIE